MPLMVTWATASHLLGIFSQVANEAGKKCAANEQEINRIYGKQPSGPFHRGRLLSFRLFQWSQVADVSSHSDSSHFCSTIIVCPIALWFHFHFYFISKIWNYNWNNCIFISLNVAMRFALTKTLILVHCAETFKTIYLIH